MEPKTQRGFGAQGAEGDPEPRALIEIQLGHMCNNRCVFCVSGQETALGRARPLPLAPILEQIRAARAAGHRKITLLGGEPTLQPAFLDVVRESVALGFEEIVIFTNGVKTARAAFVDEILATGGNFTFRFSIQGATEEAHERTTRKDGSFARIVQSMHHVRARGQRLTVNMCVVQSNHESVDAFPDLLLPLGVSQLHLDMVRPLDAGVRTEAEFAAMIPRYRSLVGPLERMVSGFPEGFDVNIGNLPYCVAPHLAPFIHHDGEKTMTIAVDGEKTLSKPWDKYLVKRRDKSKPAGCATCVFDARCNGVFETYREMYGDEEFVPVTPERLVEADPSRKLFSVHARALVAQAFAGFVPPNPFSRVTLTELGERAVEVRLEGEESLVVTLRPRSEGEGIAATDWFSVGIVAAPADRAASRAGILAIGERLSGHVTFVHPIGEDAALPLVRSVAARTQLLRRRAPFGALAWKDVRVLSEGRRAELGFEAPSGERAWVWLGETNGKPVGGYRVGEGQPSAEVIEGLRAVLGALSPGGSGPRAAPP
ncbi:radical SAM protein [Polyangium jinanense]|uniref:Radical SAM protein n=1 Tax=Polyangium jinanense TaxID=2829994 RepID=A0A9X3X9N1_9BACT|nr:radical SAM protein [Polyangium jinanense]MDC3960212.1 radical SAM protein [Polyangium jinanense]MDC3984928.1 radical SAM protein [Polyangium jinanense]